MKIDTVFNELQYQFYVNSNESKTQKEEDDKHEESKQQAKSQLLEAVLSVLSKKLHCVCTEADYLENGCVCGTEAYNQAIDECTQAIKKLFESEVK